jgi:hypothetical protein
MGTGMDNGPCPWSVKEWPDIIIAVIRRLHCIHFYIKPGPKVQWKNAASPILLAHYFSLDIRFGIAYNAALKLCTILLYTEGYRPEKTLQHFRVRCLFECV